MMHTSRVCAACGKVGEIYSETHCEPCFNALAKTREAKQDPVAAFKVKVERPDPEEERARELMERRRLDEMHAVDKKPKGHEWPTDDWFARYSRIDKLCWHCQRNPGEDRFRGACEGCMGKQIQPEGAKVDEAKTDQRPPIKPASMEERKATIVAILQQLGPKASQRAVYEKIREAGCQTPGVENYYRIRRELWPELYADSKAANGTPRTPRVKPAAVPVGQPAAAPTHKPTEETPVPYNAVEVMEAILLLLGREIAGSEDGLED